MIKCFEPMILTFFVYIFVSFTQSIDDHCADLCDINKIIFLFNIFVLFIKDIIEYKLYVIE